MGQLPASGGDRRDGACGRRRASRRHSRRLVFTLLCLTTLTAASLPAAQAQNTDVPDPTSIDFDTVQDAPHSQHEPAEGVELLDTDTTPRAKPTDEWKQVAGALFPAKDGDEPTRLVEDSPTTYDDNLFDVDFSNSELGLAGGARCESSDPDADQSQDPATLGCRPVAYLYTNTPERGEVWEEAELPNGDEPGFVGAIAWLDQTTAMAVGGTGTYPRREPAYKKTIDGQDCQEPAPGEPYGFRCDQAGTARAWLYRDGEWCELERGSPCPGLPRDHKGEIAHGLTALDFRLDQDGTVLGFAGGLGQIARWQGTQGGQGSFDKLYENASPDTDLDPTPAQGNNADPDRFVYRVRDLRFFPLATTNRAVAATSGCCSPDSAQANVLVWSDQVSTGGFPPQPRPAQWYVHGGAPGNADLVPPGTDPTGAAQPPKRDSFYSVFAGAPNNTISHNQAPYGLLSNAGGPPGPGEPPSALQSCQGSSSSGGAVNPDPAPTARLANLFVPWDTKIHNLNLSTTRLLAVDGPLPSAANSSCGAGPEWMVGELRSQSEPAYGRRGLVVATRTSSRTPSLTDPPHQPTDTAAAEVTDKATQEGAGYRPTDEERIRRNQASLVYLTTSYTLNSLDLIGESSAGWAVGDHGAIMRIGGPQSAGRGTGAEPPAPRLGSPRPARFSDRGPADRVPAAAKVGPVPPLAAQPHRLLDEPRMVNTGSPDATFEVADPDLLEDVAQIVMSRDGSEGWAIGSHSPADFSGFGGAPYGVASFYYYDGATWTRCDPQGIPAQLSADHACAEVAPLRELAATAGSQATRLVAAARVPLENDGDPKNDDDFEVVAVGTAFRDEDTQPVRDDPVILRYRNGSWRFEPLEARRAVTSVVPVPAASPPSNTGQLTLKDVAFTAPDDGWILARRGIGAAAQIRNELYHFDGEVWHRCRLAESRDPQGAGTVYHPDDESLVDCGAKRIPAAEAATGTRSRQMRMVGAGERLYLYGHRPIGAESPCGVSTVIESLCDSPTAPFILYHERGGGWTDGAQGGAGGGYDPSWNEPRPGVAGTIRSLAVARTAEGWAGWAVGQFYDSELPLTDGGLVRRDATALLMRLDPASQRWRRFTDHGAVEDYMRMKTAGDVNWTEPRNQATVATRLGGEEALIAQNETGRLFGFDAGEDAWRTIDAGGRPPQYANPGVSEHWREGVNGHYQTLASDNQGGVWAAVKNDLEANWGLTGNSTTQVFFYHYTANPRKDVFTDAPYPFGERNVKLTALAGAPDGSVWAASDSSTLARYERGVGWQTVDIPGWDPGRVVTRTSAVNALALGPDGSGVAVGERGRIAKLTPTSVGLDGAASVLCAAEDSGPGCGTSRDLGAVSVAPDGSALAGGDASTLLWRAPNSPFQRIADAPGGRNAKVTGISMPSPTQAWLTNDKGLAFAGRMTSPGTWSWRLENRIASGPNKGTILGSITADTNLPLRAVAIDAEGHGYAVGDKGLVLERTDDEDQPWRRLRGPGTNHLTSVTLAQGEGEGALIGGQDGVIWTAQGESVEVSRPADYFRFHPPGDERALRGPLTGPVVGMALLPGYEDGEAEAWVGIEEKGEGTDRLLHYSSDPSNPLLDPSHAPEPLPDSQPSRAGELAFAAFGKSDCMGEAYPCPPILGTGDSAEVALEGIKAQTMGLKTAPKPKFALFTGDAAFTTGASGARTARFDKHGDPTPLGAAADFGLIASSEPRQFGARHHRRFAERVVDPLAEAGTPLLGALGPGDLSRPFYGGSAFGGRGEETKTGENLPWREGLAEMPAPWGKADSPESTELSFEPAEGAADRSQEAPEATVDPDLDEERTLAVEPYEIKNGARTHYATDVLRDGEEIARIVVVDSSLRDLATADPIQNPLEQDGQLAWLEGMLCFRGQSVASGRKCTRERSQAAIVLSNTPTYTYAPINPTGLATDGAVLEALYLKYRVSVVVSGRLGWNGLYYALRPGLHAPCPGDDYPERPPEPGVGLCESVSSRLPVQDPSGGQGDGAARAGDQGGVDVSEITAAAGGGSGLVPFVVASGAGGKFGPDGRASGSAAEGFWHGYTIVRVPADGDPRGVVVEQRPLIDTLAIEGNTRVLKPRQKLRLRGLAREPIGFSQATNTSLARYNEITTQAITHRYDLLAADPEEPWLALTDQDAEETQQDGADACGPYVCLPTEVGTVDRTSGQIRAGAGKHPPTDAILLLSVGERSASYPLHFLPSPSFRAEAPIAPRPTPAIGAVAAPGSPSAPPIPSVPSVSFPSVPTPPALVPPPPAPPAQPPQPPVPPPIPPADSGPSALSLNFAPTGLVVAPVTSPIPPPAPPINPAPPGGARREARQRQAATQKSGADNEGGVKEDSMRSDGAASPEAPHGNAMTRHDPASARQEHAFTRLERNEGATPALVWAGGITLLAAVLAAGCTTLRPGSRRREPRVPAPAFSSVRRKPPAP